MSGDLPEINKLMISDPLVKFEKTFPFYRTHIKRYCDALISLINDDKHTITLDEFKSVLKTGAWNQAYDKGELEKLLKATPEYDSEAEAFDAFSLIILGVLWCAGEPFEKSDAFFQCLNPPGQAQQQVAANDLEWSTMLDRLTRMATIWTV